ncbi:MAG TPA: thioredoxin [Verrucomicrobiae bacterium]|nr:thioredoxin [Verrucomicrobiae bacterium]
MANQHVVTLSVGNFEQEVSKSATPVLVDFWAEWCGPCKMISPLLDELAEEKVGKVKVAKVNVDDNQELATRFGIRAIPTLLLFQGGQIKETIVGMTGKKDLEKKLASYIN